MVGYLVTAHSPGFGVVSRLSELQQNSYWLVALLLVDCFLFSGDSGIFEGALVINSTFFFSFFVKSQSPLYPLHVKETRGTPQLADRSPLECTTSFSIYSFFAHPSKWRT